jgi:hypothetical protein
MLQSPEPNHLILKPMAERGQDSVVAVRVRRLFTTETASLPSTTRVLLALPDGRPLLLEGTVGHGRVLLFTSTGDADWNELAVSTGYLPLIHTGVAYLAHREGQERLSPDIRLPQPIIAKVQESSKEALVTIIDPQGTETRLFPQDRDGQMQAEFSEPRLPGLYHLRVGPEVGLAAVNTPLEESDMSAIEADEVREKFPGSPFAFVGWERGQPLRPPQVEPMSLAGWFLICLLALMLVEGVFANRLR